MKKKLLTSLGCLALAVAGAFGLVGCGAKPDVSFGKVKGFYREHNVSVQESSWKKISSDADDTNFDKLTAAYEMTDAIKLSKADDDTKEAFGSDYVVCITFAGKGRSVNDIIVKVSKDTYPADWKSEEAGTNETARDGETDFHAFMSVDVSENKTTKKVVYLYLDWDGNEETTEDTEIYRFVIPAGLALADAE